MTKNVPAFIARTQFGQILERVSRNGERFVVTGPRVVQLRVWWAFSSRRFDQTEARNGPPLERLLAETISLGRLPIRLT